MKKTRIAVWAMLTFGAVGGFTAEAKAQATSFDLATGNALTQVIGTQMIDPAMTDLSPTRSDASLVLHYAVIITNAWFDAVAPYHPTAVGVYSDFARRPPEESIDNTNVNLALLYSSIEAMSTLSPQRVPTFRDAFQSVGLDPDAQSDDPASPIHIGRTAARAVIRNRDRDGMNRLGDEGGKHYLLQPYADYTAYEPVNSAFAIRNPSRWQPAITSQNGIFKVQQFVTPQLGITEPYSFDDPGRFEAPPPVASQIDNRTAYRRQADEVLHASANLTDEQKFMAELFNDKLDSLALATIIASAKAGHSLIELIQYDFAVNVANFDTAIVVWKEKRKHDAMRPFTAIRYLYGSDPLRAWGGPGRGTVDDLPADEWRSYLPVADHPEYPSGSAAFCGSQAEASRLFLHTDQLDHTVQLAAGASFIEPGITPASDLAVTFSTWTDFEERCAESRLWGGVHFRAATVAGRELGRRVARKAHRFVMSHISGRPRR